MFYASFGWMRVGGGFPERSLVASSRTQFSAIPVMSLDGMHDGMPV